ncbi:MAG: hypothetical protein WAK20_17435 [Candidatus Acidiferrum sp.]
MFHDLLNNPIPFFAISTFVLWLSAIAGTALRNSRWRITAEEREDLGVVVTASLTLLGLIIGFTFSMAMTRYDQRKNYEEAEANAIGTEYVRADLLPAADAQKLRSLLRAYTEQRIRFYKADRRDLKEINAKTVELQNELWSTLQAPARETPTPITMLAVSGMNDVLNSQGYTQAAWWNRIPTAAWILMISIAISCNVLIGYWSQPSKPKHGRFLVFSVIVSIAFLLIADIESPRGGVIRVIPQNLQSVLDSLPGQ